MSYLADAHREWHVVHGAMNSNCPLDCGVGEAYTQDWPLDDGVDAPTVFIRCGYCGGIHGSVDAVRACFRRAL